MKYYHVTKERNVAEIAKSGLQASSGGSDTGMAQLRFNAQAKASGLSSAFVEESKGKVHFTSLWDAVVRYCSHSLLLSAKIANSGKPVSDTEKYDKMDLGDLPVVLACEKDSGVMTKDKHDEAGVTTTQDTAPTDLKIAVEKRATSEGEGPFFWLPIKDFNPDEHRPGYPDADNF